MAKLVYDRPIKITVGDGQFVWIPEDEVWRLTCYTPSTSQSRYGGGRPLVVPYTLRGSLLNQLSDVTMEEVILHG